MKTRSFTVYVDTPSNEVQPTKATDSTARSSTAPPTDINSSIAVANKENVHPVTGERVTYSPTGKKRKTTVLALKACTTKDASAIAESSDSQPQLKKRKAASSSTRAKAKKDAKVPVVSRKGVKKPSKRASSLPKVEEEKEKEENAKNVLGMSQGAIDSKCYELTVSPLADVSEAYDETADLRGFLPEGEIYSPFVKVSATSSCDALFIDVCSFFRIHLLSPNCAIISRSRLPLSLLV